MANMPLWSLPFSQVGDLDVQQGLFKLTMKSNIVQAIVEVVVFTSDKVNPTIINPLTWIWWVIHASKLLSNAFLEYLRVAKIAVVHVLGFVEDERCFSFVAFLKNKVQNKLNNHLHLVVSMYTQKFFRVNNFPYKDTYKMWSNVQLANGRGQYA